MGVTIVHSTLGGGLTPICSSCGILLCWDISDDEYEDAKEFWDNWECSDCNPNYEGALKKWKKQKNQSKLNI